MDLLDATYWVVQGATFLILFRMIRKILSDVREFKENAKQRDNFSETLENQECSTLHYPICGI